MARNESMAIMNKDCHFTHEPGDLWPHSLLLEQL
jgi:hypothetical protein